MRPFVLTLMLACLPAVFELAPRVAAQDRRLRRNDRFLVFYNYYIGQQRAERLREQQRELRAEFDRARRAEAPPSVGGDGVSSYIESIRRGEPRGSFRAGNQRPRPAARIGNGLPTAYFPGDRRR